MTFLQLCQDLMVQGGIAGTIASVTGQNGEALRVVNWIQKAYSRIQAVHADWEFLRGDVAFVTTIGSDTYNATAAGIAGFGEWRFAEEWRAYTTAIGVQDEQPIRYVDYDDFRRIYQYGANRLMTGRPLVVTQRPDQSLQFWPLPDAPYTIIGEYFKAPLVMLANDDVPGFPAKFHDVIVYRALMLYGQFEGDATVFASAQAECARILSQMEALYMPEWDTAGPMA